MIKPSYLTFDSKNYYWKRNINYRLYPELYKVGKGEQGVLICQPYKDEIGKYWRFKTSEIAQKSSEKIYDIFLQYLRDNDFVGADLARKYLQMGFTRARRYANYKSGKKYDHENGYKQLPKGMGEPEKAQSAQIFYYKWRQAESNSQYFLLKKKWKELYG